MRKISYLAAFALAATAAFTACKKDDDNNSSVSGASRKTTLVANEWILSEVRLNNQLFTDSLLDACDKDNFTKFTADNKFYELEGANKCTAGEDTASKGTYSFSTDYSKITVDPSDESAATMNITEFKSNTFSVESRDSILGQPFNLSYRFTKK